MKIARTLVIFSLLLSGCMFRWIHHPTAKAEIKERHTVPLRFFGTELLVQASINGSDPAWFFVDTGAPISAIDPSFLRGVSSARYSHLKISVGGATEGRASSRVVRVNDLTLGGVTFDRVIAIELDMTPIEEVLGVDIGGILGLSTFQDFLLTLDYPNKQLIIEEGALPKENNEDILPFTISQKHLMVSLLHNGKKVPVAIDSGCNSAIYLPDEAEGTFDFVVPPIVSGTALGATGEAEVRSGRVRGEMALGAFTIQEPVITFAKTDLALLGGPILHHFVVTIDQKNQRVRLVQPEPKEIKVPSLRKFAGLKKKGGRWVIASVRDSSAPFLIVGDVVVSANNKDAAAMDYSDWEGLIDSPDPIKLVLLRGETTVEVDIGSEIVVP